MEDEFAVIAPPERVISIAGTVVTLRPLTVGQIPTVMRLLKRFMDGGGSLSTLTEGTEGVELITLMAEHGDPLIEVIAAATGQPVEVVAGGSVDEFVDLFLQVIEINADFFVQRVVPQMTQAVHRVRMTLQTQATGAGQTASAH